MKYIALVYASPAQLAHLSLEELTATAAACGAWVDDLEKNGNHVYSTGLQSASTALTIRTENGRQTVTDGPFAEAKELVGGFTIFEARDLNEAVSQASKLGAVCQGTVEVRPLFDPFGELSDPGDMRLAEAIRSAMEPA